MKTTKIAGALVTLAASMICLTGYADEKPILVGVIAGTTGAYGSTGVAVVNGAQMVQNMTEAARNRYISRGFPLFLPDDAFFNDEGRQFRNKMHAWLMGALLAWLMAFALLAIRFYVLHCAGFEACGRVA